MQTRRWLLEFAWVLPGLWSCQPNEGEELNQQSAQEPEVPALEAGAGSSTEPSPSTATEDSATTEDGAGDNTASSSDSLGETSSDDTSNTSNPTPAPTQGACSFGSGAGGSGSIRPLGLNCDEYHDSLPEPAHATVDRYPCFDADLPGYESVYHFEPEFSGPLSGFIDPTPGIDVVLLLLEEDCDPARCVAGLAIEDYGEWAMDYEVQAGRRYYLVVEGGTPTERPVYAMSINCE